MEAQHCTRPVKLHDLLRESLSLCSQETSHVFVTSILYLTLSNPTFLPTAYSPALVVCFLLGNSPASEIQTPGNYPEENKQHTEHDESLKSRISPALICFGRERDWWITYNFSTVLKEENIEKQKEYNLRYLLAKVRTT
jgi:hypothetical protein